MTPATDSVPALELQANVARVRLARSLSALSDRRKQLVLLSKQAGAAAGMLMAILGAKAALSLLGNIARRNDPARQRAHALRASRPSIAMQIFATGALGLMAVSLFKLAKHNPPKPMARLRAGETTQSTIAPTNETNDSPIPEEFLP